jgi:hypothetical protein
MISPEKINELKKLLEKSNKYIRSENVKNKIKDIYETDWIVNKQEINQDNPRLSQDLEELFDKMYSLSRKDFFLKSDCLKLIKKIQNLNENIKIEELQRGIKFKEDFKQKIFSELNSKGISESVRYFKKSEENIIKDPETSCTYSRKAIEEIFRIMHERFESKSVDRGTLGDHSSYLQRTGKITSVEKQFFNSGIYSFLSEKGNHANKERKEPADALFGFKIALICSEYLIQKGLIK